MNLNKQNNPLLLKQQFRETLSINNTETLDVIFDTKMISRLPNNLMHIFNITDGDYLTFILGHGECTHNKQALQYWIVDQLNGYHDAGNLLSYLVKQLKNQLIIEVCQ